MHRIPTRLVPVLLALAPAAVRAQAPAPPAALFAGVEVPAVPRGVFVDRPRADEPTRWLRGERYKASVDGDAMTFIPFLGAEAPRNQPIRFEVAAVRCAGKALDATAGQVSDEGHRVTVHRRDFVEVYDALPGGLEQSFRFDRLEERGALAIELDFAGEVEAIAADGDVLFRGPLGDVRYSGLVVMDARGARRELPIAVDGRRITLAVPADFVAAATLPLVVDPIAVTATIMAVPDQRMEPDIAWNETYQEYLAVWRVPFSATDWDVAAVRVSALMTPAAPQFWIDFTSAHWERPRVACKQLEGMFLVVGQTSFNAVAPFSIVGRRYQEIGATNVLHPQFDIQRAGVANHLSGDAFRPDVGGDPWTGGGPAYFTVVWEHRLPGGNGDIEFRQIRADGTFVTAAPITLNSGPYDDSEPAISKSPGQGVYGVVWTQHNGLGGAGDIVAAEISYDGLIIVPAFFLDASANDDSKPRVSTPTDLIWPSYGGRVMLVTWQRNFNPFSNVGRLHCAAITNNSAAVLVSRWDLSALLGLTNQTMAFDPVVDSDGTRFAVAHTEQTTSTGRIDVYASTLALSGNQLLVHEGRLLLRSGTSQGFTPSIASRYGGSLANSRAYGIVTGTDSISVVGWVYDGRQSGPLWTVRGGGCGNLTLTHTGLPTLGDTIGLDVAGNDPFRAVLIGYPMPLAPVGPCPGCWLGVTGGGAAPAPYSWQVPYLPGLVGLTLSAQGFAIGAGPCLGQIKLSDAVDFTLR